MPRRYRPLWENMSLSPQLGILSDAEERLFVRLQASRLVTDDYGNFTWQPDKLWAATVALCAGWDANKIQYCLRQIEGKGLIRSYWANGRQYGHIVAFVKHAPMGHGLRRSRFYPKPPFDDEMDVFASFSGGLPKKAHQIAPNDTVDTKRHQSHQMTPLTPNDTIDTNAHQLTPIAPTSLNKIKENKEPPMPPLKGGRVPTAFSEAMRNLAADYGKRVGKRRLARFYQCLANLSAEQIERVCSLWQKKRDHFPKRPQEFSDFAKKIADGYRK